MLVILKNQETNNKSQTSLDTSTLIPIFNHNNNPQYFFFFCSLSLIFFLNLSWPLSHHNTKPNGQMSVLFLVNYQQNYSFSEVFFDSQNSTYSWFFLRDLGLLCFILFCQILPTGVLKFGVSQAPVLKDLLFSAWLLTWQSLPESWLRLVIGWWIFLHFYPQCSFLWGADSTATTEWKKYCSWGR